MTRTLPVSEKTQLTRKTGPDKPVAITKRDATLLTKEDENKKGRIEDVNACAEHQTWDPLEVDDYQEDVDLTPLMKRLSEKPTLATAPLRTMSVCKAEASKSEPSKYATPQDATHKAVDAIVASEQRTSAQTTMTLSTQHSTQTTVSKGDIVVGRRVQCLGRYKDLTGVIQLVDKKKRAVKVLLDKFGVSVSIAIALVATLEEVPAQ
jgi:transcription antitermination factor NusG